MATNTRIEWADSTINPLVGCSKISPACNHCYAERMAARMVHNPAVAHRYAGTVDAHGKWTGKINVIPNELLEKARRMRRPRRIFVGSMSDLFHPRVPAGHIARIFTQMAIVGHHTYMLLTKRPDRMREMLSQQDMQDAVRSNVLRWRDEADLPPQDFRWPLPNVWLGTTVEDQARADERVPELLATPGALHFVSCEPLLGPVDLRKWLPGSWECSLTCGYRQHEWPEQWFCGTCGYENSDDGAWGDPETCPECGCGDSPQTPCPMCGLPMYNDHPDTPYLRWVIAGGETGPGARPAHPDWFRSLRDQCAEAIDPSARLEYRVPFFFKSWGEWLPAPEGQFNSFKYPHQGYLSPDLPYDELPGPSGANGEGLWGPEKLIAAGCAHVVRVGKAISGRLLDGVEHNSIPAGRG